jgi:hypothetical protein
MNEKYVHLVKGYDNFIIPYDKILYIKGSTAHGSEDFYIVKLVTGEEIEQQGFKELLERLAGVGDIF